MSTDHDWFKSAAGKEFLSVRMTRALSSVLEERRRQIDIEGYTTQHDDLHTQGEIAQAAADYLSPERVTAAKNSWAQHKARHPRRQQLVIGAALALAEIERLDRRSCVLTLEDSETPAPESEKAPAEPLGNIERLELHLLRARHEQERLYRGLLEKQLENFIQKVVSSVKDGSMPNNLTDLENWLLQEVTPDA